ncbi:BnaC03g34160D [Brassica napus]|uniref:BnaC03g34160D protein n=1 Tax=Brassica napus TaxID=3708 RepID=A0A078HQ45_BRANA|nr:BnaC03g34160D [Brassica napus]
MAFPSSSFDFLLGSISGMNRLAAEGELFKLGTVHFICVSNDNSEGERSFSKGVNIKFGSEKDSKEFCDSFEEWRKDALVPGAS